MSINSAKPSVRLIGGLTITAATPEVAVEMIGAAIGTGKGAVFTFCNANTVNLARKNVNFRKSLASFTVFNDGIGVDIAAHLLGQDPFPANLNGTDLTPALLAILPPDTSVFLLGSPPGVAELARFALAARFPQLTFVGADQGWFSPVEEPEIAARIKASGADLVLVGMGQPRQELWAERYHTGIDCAILCVGAYIDFAAGRFRRAPAWIRAARLEWLFRLVLEPRRLARRYLIGNAMFLAGILADRRSRGLGRVC